MSRFVTPASILIGRVSWISCLPIARDRRDGVEIVQPILQVRSKLLVRRQFKKPCGSESVSGEPNTLAVVKGNIYKITKLGNLA